jgi:hypothetical protein
LRTRSAWSMLLSRTSTCKKYSLHVVAGCIQQSRCIQRSRSPLPDYRSLSGLTLFRQFISCRLRSPRYGHRLPTPSYDEDIGTMRDFSPNSHTIWRPRANLFFRFGLGTRLYAMRRRRRGLSSPPFDVRLLACLRNVSEPRTSPAPSNRRSNIGPRQ